MYNKETIKNCSVCLYSTVLSNGTEAICKKRGPVLCNDYCRKFKYDPLKREPEIKTIKQYSFKDFDIDHIN